MEEQTTCAPFPWRLQGSHTWFKIQSFSSQHRERFSFGSQIEKKLGGLMDNLDSMPVDPAHRGGH